MLASFDRMLPAEKSDNLVRAAYRKLNLFCLGLSGNNNGNMQVDWICKSVKNSKTLSMFSKFKCLFLIKFEYLALIEGSAWCLLQAYTFHSFNHLP